MSTQATKDYAINMRDGAGRTATIFITADSINDLLATGMPLHHAVESVEGNAFANAIARGEIGADAWVQDWTV